MAGTTTARRAAASTHPWTGSSLIRELDDARALAAIRECRIDILVNLNGYFGDDRMRLFAQRPAPLQVNYLGFPGTLGARYMDYIIADRVVIPPDQREFYCEKVAYLPHCYQANDREREIADRAYQPRRVRLARPWFRALLLQQCLQDHACHVRLLDANPHPSGRQRALAA